MEAVSVVTDLKDDYRYQLLVEARLGKVAAKEELQTEYHVRVYTAAERKKLQQKFHKAQKGCRE